MIRWTSFKFFLVDVISKNEEEETFIVDLKSLIAQILLFDCQISDDWLAIEAESVKAQHSVWHEQIDDKKFTLAMSDLQIWDLVDDFVSDDLVKTDTSSMRMSYSFESSTNIAVTELNLCVARFTTSTSTSIATCCQVSRFFSNCRLSSCKRWSVSLTWDEETLHLRSRVSLTLKCGFELRNITILSYMTLNKS
jgi:hypothetical protein